MHYLSVIFLTLHTAGSIQKSFKQNSLDLNMAANFQNKIRPWMFGYYLINPGLSNSKVLCCLRTTKRISIPQGQRSWKNEKIITRQRLVRENSRNSFSHEKRRTQYLPVGMYRSAPLVPNG